VVFAVLTGVERGPFKKKEGQSWPDVFSAILVGSVPMDQVRSFEAGNEGGRRATG
jgi:hypothetical protein